MVKEDHWYIFHQIEFSYTLSEYRFSHDFPKNLIKSVGQSAVFQTTNRAKILSCESKEIYEINFLK